MKAAWRRALSVAVVAGFVSLGLTSCGKVPDFSAAGAPDFDKAVDPQSKDTVVNNWEIQTLTPTGVDEKAMKVLKETVGSPLQPFKESDEARLSKAFTDAASQPGQPAGNDSGDDGDDSGNGGGDAAASGTPPAQPQDSNAQAAATPQTAPTQTAVMDQLAGGPAKALGVMAAFKDPNNEDIGIRYVEMLRKKLPHGYIVFITDSDKEGAGFFDGNITVMKSSDPYEMIKAAGTAGGGLFHSAGNDEIVKQFKEWNSKYPLHIVKANHDTVIAVLDKVPEDPDKLGREVHKFAPGDGSAKASDFIDDVRQRRIYCWWD
jgi:hypothetical protein